MRNFLWIVIIGIWSTFTKINAQFAHTTCSDQIQSWKIKKTELVEITNRLPTGNNLNHESLRRIIYPEYMSYNETSNSYECSLIKLLYTIGSDRFSTISIGPFQMQLKFINTILKALPPTPQTEIVYKTLEYGDYKAMVDQLQFLSKIETQWEILLMYERYASVIGLFKDKSNTDMIVNYYNSGKTYRVYSNFSKLDCDSKNYLDWSIFFSTL
jgi:hypothetical protein